MKLKIVYYSWVLILLLSSVSFAEEIVCLNINDWKKAIVSLDDYRICQEEKEYIKQDNQELEKQNELLKKNIELLKQSYETSQKIIDNYKQFLEIQDEACKKALKDAKPSFFQKVGEAVIYIGIGIGIGMFLL